MTSINDRYDPTPEEREEQRVYHENRAHERRRGWEQVPPLTESDQFHFKKPHLIHIEKPKEHPSCGVCYRDFNRKLKPVMNYCSCNFFMCCNCTRKCGYICPVCRKLREDIIDLTDL